MEGVLGFRLGGREREYVAVRLTGQSEWRDSVERWSTAEVRINVGPFYAEYEASFGVEEFARFLEQLRTLRQTLAGEANFEPIERQLVIRVTANLRGNVEITGEAWDWSLHNRLRFGLSLDQTYLEQPIRELEATVGRMAPNSNPRNER